MLINFGSFFVTFLSNLGDFDEKVDFAIKKHCFLMFFDVNFDQILVFFGVILGSF